MNINMKKMNYSIFVFLLGLALRAVIASAQADQPGFISIDCGQTENVNYTDPVTSIFYTSDSGFIDSGVSKSISPNYAINSLDQQYLNVRSFPEGRRNCYTLRPDQGKNGKYLIRASFMYGNYDGLNQLPEFDIHLGVEYWFTAIIRDASIRRYYDLIHIPKSDYINICLIKTGSTTPFISTLELRSLRTDSYPTQIGSLNYTFRVNFNPLSDEFIRYKNDSLDRIWTPQTLLNTSTLSTKSIVRANDIYDIPSIVMSTACTPANPSENLEFSWSAISATDEFYIYMHFAELEELQANQTRNFSIYINDTPFLEDEYADYLKSTTVYSIRPRTGSTLYNVNINKTANSTLPPMINAIQIYKVIEFSLPGTFDGDFNAMQSIKSTYNITKNWQGDPCSPEDFKWDGLTCIKDGFDPSRIISLNLSSNGLIGPIVSFISSLTKLQILDLSNNNLSGEVPSSLAQLDSLEVLNLQGNNFTMPFPVQLLEKQKQGKLQFRFDGPGGTSNNPNESNDSCQTNSCKKKKNNVAVPIVAVLFLLAVLFIVFWVYRRRKQRANTQVDTAPIQNDVISGKSYDTVETKSSNNSDFVIVGTKSRQFSYHEVLSMTNNFQRVIGKGGFGTVYHGYVGNTTTQVAVKMLSQTSTQGYKEFQSEANLLLTIHHKNLTSLVGYCYEGTNMGIIYEYMANGNVEKHLLGKGPYVLTWEERLRIAIDAGQGLEYLHHGCIPPVVHRDVKTTNILLDEKFQAKLADFGLSRAFPIDDGTQISTMVAGTPGYLDPEYYSSARLTEKSDVYSFGIILMELITGRSALPRNNVEKHIISWISNELEKGDIENIIDPRLQKDYAISSVWKVVELAMACVARNSIKRPTMNFIVMELKACLEMEMTHNEAESRNSIGVSPMSLESGLGPQAR